MKAQKENLVQTIDKQVVLLNQLNIFRTENLNLKHENQELKSFSNFSK